MDYSLSATHTLMANQHAKPTTACQHQHYHKMECMTIGGGDSPLTKRSKSKQKAFCGTKQRTSMPQKKFMERVLLKCKYGLAITRDKTNNSIRSCLLPYNSRTRFPSQWWLGSKSNETYGLDLHHRSTLLWKVPTDYLEKWISHHQHIINLQKISSTA
jgi:hypothetical protein